MIFSGISFSKPVRGPWGTLAKLFSPDSPFNLCPVCSQHSKIIQNPQTLHRARKSKAILVMITSLLACPFLPLSAGAQSSLHSSASTQNIYWKRQVRDYKWRDTWQRGLATGRVWMLDVGHKEPISEHIPTSGRQFQATVLTQKDP